ncbi:MAG: type IV toxin-antitoxin system AbiEi family antitoxin domain-containing protein [Chloroflexi bacterium]|nr:type IV toxin-antitoxin system AbiEi family antitoxin domain-containing protein [Chloroflexota bacterium]
MVDASEALPTPQAPSQHNRSQLFDIASEQGGYFTSEQAQSRGFSWALLSHHAKTGRFIRVRRGACTSHWR